MAGTSPIANLTEKFNTDANWTSSGSGTNLFTGDAESLLFAARASGYPWTVQWQDSYLIADASASSGRFVGDYASAGITAFSFDVKRNGLEDSSAVWIVGGPRTYSHPFTLPPGTSEYVRVVLSLTNASEWNWVGPAGGSLQTDLGSVTSVKVCALRTGTNAGSITVDNFKLIGPWSGPMTADGLPVYWQMEYGLTNGNGNADDDPDHDGFSNYGEFLAGTDPSLETGAKSFFAVSITRDVGGKAVLRWDHASGRTYTVLRSSDLTGSTGFQPVTGVPPQTLGGTQDVFTTDEGGQGPFFYKVQIQ